MTPAPGWLRFGAPQGSLVYLKEAGKLVAYDLQAHRWDDSGYWAMLEQGDELMPFRYSELLDSSGARIFEDHAHTKPPTVPVVDDTAAAPQAFPGVESALHYEFATRIVIEADGTEVATPRFRTLYQIVRDGFYDPASAAPVRTPRNDSTRLLDVDTAPRGLWRKREKLREILTKLESQKETALRAVRIANVTKTLKRTEEQLLANSEGGLSANIRPALGRGLGAMLGKDAAQAPQTPGVKDSLTAAPEQRLLTAYAKLDRTGLGRISIPDLAREAGMTAAQIKPVLAAMNERGEIYLTPSDEPRDLTAEQRAFLIPNGISPAGLYVTKLAGLAANARPALNKLDLASASDESISYEPQQASPSALEFVLRDENSISREDRDALQWIEDNYGQRTIPVSAGGLSSLLRQGDSSKGGQSQASMRTLDMATQDGDTAISHDSPSSFSFDAVADSDLDREQLAAIEWARRTYGERIEALRLLGEHGSNSALHAGMAAGNAHGFQSAVKTALHKELLVFSSPMDVGMDAVSAAKSRNVLLVNKASRVSLLWLTGHELGHAINAQDPTLFQQWRQWVLSHVSDWSEHRAMLVNDFYYTPTQVTDEFVNDAQGALFMDPEFWAAAATHPRLADMARAAETFLRKVPGVMPRRDGARFFKDAFAARREFAAMLDEHARRDSFPMLGGLSETTDEELARLGSTERPLRDDPEMAALLDALNAPFTNEERSELYSRAGFNNWGDDLC